MILEAIDIVLKNNTFEFNGQFYLQLIGTAMGTKMAPTYANLVLGYLETKLYSKIEQTHGLDLKIFVEKGWKRFLDDAYITWDEIYGDINVLLEVLNGLHPRISFTLDYQSDSIPFLDILLLRDKENNRITTDIFHKKTDTFNYLPFGSCHPRHVKTNIPYTLARRIRLLTEDNTTREKRYKELSSRLSTKGYPQSIIDRGIQKAKAISNTEIISSEPKQKAGLTAVFTHNPNNKNVEHMIKNTIGILENSSTMKSVLNSKKLTVARRQPKNLKRFLTSASFNSGVSYAQVKKCSKNCETCKLITEGPSLKISNQNFKVRHNMNCESKKFNLCNDLCRMFRTIHWRDWNRA